MVYTRTFTSSKQNMHKVSHFLTFQELCAFFHSIKLFLCFENQIPLCGKCTHEIPFTNPAPPHFQLYFGLYYHFTRKSEILVFLICSYKIAKKKKGKQWKEKKANLVQVEAKNMYLFYMYIIILFSLSVYRLCFFKFLSATVEKSFELELHRSKSQKLYEFYVLCYELYEFLKTWVVCVSSHMRLVFMHTTLMWLYKIIARIRLPINMVVVQKIRRYTPEPEELFGLLSIFFATFKSPNVVGLVQQALASISL